MRRPMRRLLPSAAAKSSRDCCQPRLSSGASRRDSRANCISARALGGGWAKPGADAAVAATGLLDHCRLLQAGEQTVRSSLAFAAGPSPEHRARGVSSRQQQVSAGQIAGSFTPAHVAFRCTASAKHSRNSSTSAWAPA
jgi:hypothetical protein